MVCHSLFQWTTFCQTSPPWPYRLGWPHMAWLSFIELDKTVVLWSDWLVFCDWFQCVCPLMPSRNTYGLTWVSLTFNMGYLFTAAPAKHSRCSLPGPGVSPHGHPSWPWTWSSSSWQCFAQFVTTAVLLALIREYKLGPAHHWIDPVKTAWNIWNCQWFDFM